MSATLIDTIPLSINAKKRISRLQRNSNNGYHFIELANSHIRYRVAGSGKHTIVLAADPPISLECYDSLSALLSKQYRVLVFELPGFGFSFPKRQMNFDFDACVEDLVELLKTWNKGPYVLAFPCASAFFSLAIANRYPNLVSHLALIQVPDWQQEQQWKQKLDPKNILATPFIGQTFLRMGRKKIAQQWIRYAAAQDEFKQHAQHHVKQHMAHGACYCLASAFQKSLPSQSPHFGTVDQDSILIIGDKDPSHRKTDFNRIHQYNNAIQLHRFAHAGHFPELEQPQLFKNAVDDLLKQNG